MHHYSNSCYTNCISLQRAILFKKKKALLFFLSNMQFNAADLENYFLLVRLKCLTHLPSLHTLLTQETKNREKSCKYYVKAWVLIFTTLFPRRSLIACNHGF